MMKKHKGGGSFLSSGWAKRWVHVNQQRGRLHIGKKPGKDGTTVFALSDSITLRSLEPLAKEAGGQFFCFLISQAPISAVLRCADDAERKRWLSELTRLADEWREKRRNEDGAQDAAVTLRTVRASGRTVEDPRATATMVTSAMQPSDDSDDDDDDDADDAVVALT